MLLRKEKQNTNIKMEFYSLNQVAPKAQLTVW